MRSCVKTTEMHTAGEPVRVVESGLPEVVGETILDKWRYMREELDAYRKLLMHEPRGHRDMYGAVLVAPDRQGAHMAALFLHNEGYSTMCGHAVIALGRYAVDRGYVPSPRPPEATVNIQCPCGMVTARVRYDDDGNSGAVSFRSVPAFVSSLDTEVYVPEFGKVKLDISYGGAFYAILPAMVLNLDVKRSERIHLIDAAAAVTEAVKNQVKITHPESEDLSFLYGTILTDGMDDYHADGTPTSNICVFANKQLDRSPTGSGVTARIALMYHKKQIGLNQTRRFLSAVTQGCFTGKAIQEVKCGHHGAVVVEVSGKAHYTGTAQFHLEDEDELGRGFLLF